MSVYLRGATYALCRVAYRPYSRITEFCSSVYIDFRQRTRVARGCPRTVSLIGYYVGPIPQFPPPLILPIVSTRLISKPQNVSDARVPHGNRGNANIVVKGDRSSLLEMSILRISDNLTNQQKTMNRLTKNLACVLVSKTPRGRPTRNFIKFGPAGASRQYNGMYTSHTCAFNFFV